MNTGPVFQQAVELFASCSGELGPSMLYRNDLIELTVQYVGGFVDRTLQLACQAHKDGRAAERDREAQRALQMMQRIDALLHTRPDQRLATWVGSARSWAASPDEAAEYDSNARLLLTFWGWSELEDYASRLWSGLVGDYYAVRWQLFFSALAGKKCSTPEDWTLDWLSRRYTPGERSAVSDVMSEAHSMLKDCRA